MFGTKPKITREFYDAIMDMSDFNHAAPAEDLTRTQDLSRFGWCKVCSQGFRPYGHVDRVRLVSVGVCEACDHAMGLLQMSKDDCTVRINGQHYRYGRHLQDARVTQDATLEKMAEAFKKANPAQQGLGMGGDTMIIRFSDGRTVITNDVWHQGSIPAIVAELLPDNAVSMERA